MTEQKHIEALGDTDSEIKSFMSSRPSREFRHLMQCGSHRGNGVRDRAVPQSDSCRGAPGLLIGNGDCAVGDKWRRARFIQGVSFTRRQCDHFANNAGKMSASDACRSGFIGQKPEPRGADEHRARPARHIAPENRAFQDRTCMALSIQAIKRTSTSAAPTSARRRPRSRTVMRTAAAQRQISLRQRFDRQLRTRAYFLKKADLTRVREFVEEANRHVSTLRIKAV